MAISTTLGVDSEMVFTAIPDATDLDRRLALRYLTEHDAADLAPVLGLVSDP